MYCASSTSDTALPQASSSVLQGLSEEEFDLFCVLILNLVDATISDPEGPIASFKDIIEEEEKRRIKSQQRAPRKVKVSQRKRFSEVINDDFPDVTFRRLFRMGRESFLKFCSIIRTEAGDDEFRPEITIEKHNSAHRGAVKRSGGAICGEVRVAIFIRLMAGASYLDLMLIFDLSHESIFRSFHMVIGWIHRSFKYPLVEALEKEDVEFFNQVALDFSYSASDGLFKNCIGALDGWAVKIKRPVPADHLRDPGAYFCRKGFFALNCQAICDFHKRITWISSRHIGSCHDSVAFTDTKLYGKLQEKSDFLLRNSFFIVGDSAYNQESFLLVPYPRPGPQSMEDSYNYYHSNCRIRIECSFGEIVMRWGIFWRTLNFDIDQVGDIISSAALVHNFIVDERVEEDHKYVTNFNQRDVDEAARHATQVDIEECVAFVSDNNEPRPSGRPTSHSVRSKEIGTRIRDSLCLSLDSYGLRRPMQPGFKINNCGMIYMDY